MVYQVEQPRCRRMHCAKEVSAEFRMSSNVDQDKWEKCRLKILRNSSSSMAPYIRINIVRQNGESTDEIGKQMGKHPI